MTAIELQAKAEAIISKIIYLTLATVSADGRPWNTPVYTAFDARYNFYWTSSPAAQHSKNIKVNPEVAIVIYDSSATEGTGEGVYIQAVASEVTDPAEIRKAIEFMYSRKNKPPRAVKDFLGESPRRIYKAAPKKFWMNRLEKISGFLVDSREEIELP